MLWSTSGPERRYPTRTSLGLDDVGWAEVEASEVTYDQLGPHVWVSRPAATWSSTSILDVARLLPPVEVDPELIRNLFPGDPSWHDLALCRWIGDVTEAFAMFFGVDNVARPALSEQVAEASRDLCIQCPVKQTCLTWALEQDERFGIWGGSTGRQRIKMRAELAAGATIPALVTKFLADMRTFDDGEEAPSEEGGQEGAGEARAIRAQSPGQEGGREEGPGQEGHTPQARPQALPRPRVRRPERPA